MKTTTIINGQEVKYTLSQNKRDQIWFIRFRNPQNDYIRQSLGTTNKPDAKLLATNIITKAYSPNHELKQASWEQVSQELEASWTSRPATLQDYLSIIRILQDTINTNGPQDITQEQAHRFIRLYQSGHVKRGPNRTETTTKRSPATVSGVLRKLTCLWNLHFRQLGYTSQNPWKQISKPKVPKKIVKIPSDESFVAFQNWLDSTYPGWKLIRLFVSVKSVAGCRTMDLCSLPSSCLNGNVLTIPAHLSKTHQERAIPLAPDLAQDLEREKGKDFLWGNYVNGAAKFNPGNLTRQNPRYRYTFTPTLMFRAINNIFKKFSAKNPLHAIKPHDLRRRAITLLTVASNGNIDQAANAIGIDPQTARKYYVDATRAFDGNELLKRMGEVLRI